MGRKRDFSILLLVFIAAIPVAFAVYQFAQLINAVQTLDAYKQAPICSDKPNCRKVIDSIVVEAKSIGTTVTFLRGSKQIDATTTKEYQVVTSWHQNKEIANFYPYKILDVNKFDIEEFSIPTFETYSFAETYFPIGDAIQIEMWNGTVTIIFMNHFTQTASPITPLPNANFPVLIPSTKTFSKISIATTAYPTYVLSQRQADFTGSIFILFIAEFVIFAAVKIFR